MVEFESSHLLGRKTSCLELRKARMGRNVGVGDICIKLLSVQRRGKNIKENGRDEQFPLT